ncbi:NifB/NifX family molybdenum-iron cluster-binding protein [Methanoculleus sp. 10]|uniref:NifB/NifX family molybdenum-iron cluster-binding protein n=1 Tax=Methanoculleus sp. 10 TaxID=430615 RepID=UPI0025D78154|nr:NifB/NifX family molybdenum-iron cluster-binding protein [Methanoculleus sp. 10]
MRIAVAGMGAGGLDDTVSPVFWASPSFTLVDAEDREILAVRIIVNPTDCVPGGAAADRFARDLAGRGVDAVIAGEFGPEETRVFSAAGTGMYRLQDMPVRDAAKQFLNLAADTVRVVGRGTVPTGYVTRTPGRQRRAGGGPR